MRDAINIKYSSGMYETNVFRLRSVVDYSKFDPDSIFHMYKEQFNITDSSRIRKLSSNVFSINDESYVVALIRDTSHEKDNKRVQGNHFIPAKRGGHHLLGLYPIKNTKPQEYVFVKWENSELQKYLGNGNPSVKVKIQSIFRKFNPSQNIPKSRIKYNSSIFTADEFINKST